MLQANSCNWLCATHICLLAHDLPLQANVTWVEECDGQEAHVLGPLSSVRRPRWFGGWG